MTNNISDDRLPDSQGKKPRPLALLLLRFTGFPSPVSLLLVSLYPVNDIQAYFTYGSTSRIPLMLARKRMKEVTS